MCVIRMSAADLHFAAEKGKKPTTAWQILHLKELKRVHLDIHFHRKMLCFFFFNLTTESTESFHIWQHFQEEANMGVSQDLYP